MLLTSKTISNPDGVPFFKPKEIKFTIIPLFFALTSINSLMICLNNLTDKDDVSMLISTSGTNKFASIKSLSMAFSQALLNLLQRFGDYKKASLETDDFRSFIELDIDDDEKDCIEIPKADTYELEFKNVSYKYAKADTYALKDLNLKIHPGEKLAVVGLNGAGKTTMIKLLLRLYDPTEGVITINGTDIRKYRREDYYRLFAPVFQNVEIFAFLMSENIAMYGREELNRDRAKECAISAGLEEKLNSLVKGIDTPLTNVVEEDGIDLSGC